MGALLTRPSCCVVWTVLGRPICRSGIARRCDWRVAVNHPSWAQSRHGRLRTTDQGRARGLSLGQGNVQFGNRHMGSRAANLASSDRRRPQGQTICNARRQFCQIKWIFTAPSLIVSVKRLRSRVLGSCVCGASGHLQPCGIVWCRRCHIVGGPNLGNVSIDQEFSFGLRIGSVDRDATAQNWCGTPLDCGGPGSARCTVRDEMDWGLEEAHLGPWGLVEIRLLLRTPSEPPPMAWRPGRYGAACAEFRNNEIGDKQMVDDGTSSRPQSLRHVELSGDR